MSLTHIGYVCSHIQNASQVRLGLTSIVATKVHVALMLALQKQGFISSVTLGSKKPPATFALQEQQQTPVKEQESSAIQDKPWLAYPQPSEATPSTQRSLKAEYERRWFGSPKLSFVNTLLAREQGTIEQFPPKVLQSYLADRKWLANVRHIWGPTEKSDAALERNSKHLMDSLDLPDSPFFTHMTELHEHEVGELQELAQWGQEQNTKRDAGGILPESHVYVVDQKLPPKKQHLQLQAFGAKAINPIAVLPQDPNHKVQLNLPPLQRIANVPQNPAQRRLWIGLKYWNSEPVIRKMSMISKPTKRMTATWADLKAILAGRNRNEIKGIVNPGECIFISTDIGMLEIREAVEKRRGGLVLCRVMP